MLLTSLSLRGPTFHIQRQKVSTEIAFALPYICFGSRSASRWWISWYHLYVLGIEEFLAVFLKFTVQGWLPSCVHRSPLYSNNLWQEHILLVLEIISSMHMRLLSTVDQWHFSTECFQGLQGYLPHSFGHPTPYRGLFFSWTSWCSFQPISSACLGPFEWQSCPPVYQLLTPVWHCSPTWWEPFSSHYSGGKNKWTFLMTFLFLSTFLCISVKSLGMFDFGAANSTLVLIVHDLWETLNIIIFYPYWSSRDSPNNLHTNIYTWEDKVFQ